MSSELLSVPCPGCGNRNPLGRVFCSGCGKKLPADGITAEQVGHTVRRFQVRQGFRRRVLHILILVVLTPFVFALWPQTRMFETGEASEADRFRSDMSGFVKALDAPSAAMRLEKTFRQKDINAYIRESVLKDHPRIDASLDLSPEGVRARWVRPLLALDQWGWAWHPSLSFETRFVVVDDRLEAAASRLGRLPLPGFLGAPVGDFFVQRLMRRDEWTVLRNLECVSVEAQALTLALEFSGD